MLEIMPFAISSYTNVKNQTSESGDELGISPDLCMSYIHIVTIETILAPMTILTTVSITDVL